MGLLDFFAAPPPRPFAKERLRIIVAQERSARRPGLPAPAAPGAAGSIRKYVNVDPAAVQINLEREDGQEVLEFSVPCQKRRVDCWSLLARLRWRWDWLRLLEPVGSSHAELLKRMYYTTPQKAFFIEDCGPLRYLHFHITNAGECDAAG